jgi:non-lysosomal glucosylceramidase
VTHNEKNNLVEKRIILYCNKITISFIVISLTCFSASKREKNIWPIPACTWTRQIGDHPTGATGRTKRGVPIGGIGAGNFMYNLCGTFGPWELKTGYHEEKFLPQAAFHLLEQTPGKSPVVKTLATEDVLSGWNKLPADSGTYYALYPKAWFVYSGTSADVSLKQFTPVIPHNYRETSYPIGIFQFNLSNPTSDTLTLALMFTFPNAAYGNDKRTGYTNHVVKENGITGVVMKASDMANVTTTQNTEWCIATRAPIGSIVSFCTSWNGNGNGQDIYNEFSGSGVLPDSAIDTSYTASAIAVKITLAPRSSTIVPFVLSWDFPRVKFGGGTEWYRRYTEYFGFTADHSFQISEEGLLNSSEWESSIDQWQNLIINESVYQDWLKQGALNELYYDTFGGIFWENGCITKPAESSYGTLPADDHKYFCMECQDYAMCETFDVRHYEARHYIELWPEIERDVLKWFADYIANDIAGSAPHDAGSPNADPFFSFSGYGSNWQDMPSKFIQQVYAYYHKTHDEAFLNFVWLACMKTYNYMLTRDTNHNGIPDIGNTTYDTWGLRGDNLLCGGLWVGALEAMEQMALIKGDATFSAQLHGNYTAIKPVLDSLFWKSDLQYYKIDVSSNAIMADGLNGERYCETTNLAPILTSMHIASHLNQVYERCVKPLKDYNGDGEGDVGVVNGRNSDGTAIGSGQPNEVWTGSSYFIAAMMYHWGVQTNDTQLQQRALKTAYGVYYQTWINNQTAYFFNTPEAWNSANTSQFRAEQYQRPRAIWELLLEIKNPFAALTSVGRQPSIKVPIYYTLFQNYPNPFNPSTIISFILPSKSFVSLKVFDLLGREVSTLLKEELSAGSYSRQWNATGMPSGIYLYRLEAGLFSETKKLVLLR